ncbi:hypothetical protein [Endozoicomonas sp. ALE010]|uniref:hypothetical protein n=1 Tax=Endozoicomonas sp. ALE010 TaxID=3403081 RepID=UPI003BB75203
MNTIFTFDWDKVYPHVFEALQIGSAVLRDGVAYWSETSGKSGIIQHMPLKSVVLDQADLNDLTSAISKVQKMVQGTQAASLVATAVSTGIIVGAIVVQTIYLANKIDTLQNEVDLISQDVNSQNIIYFMSRMSEYFGVVESARILLLDRALVDDTRTMADHLIMDLSIKRNELMSLIDNLVAFADQVSEQHLTHMLDFITTMLDILPKAIFIECQLCDRYGKFSLAEHLMRESSKRYEGILANYRAWCNDRVKQVIMGKSDPRALCFHEKKDDLKALFDSVSNNLLLAPAMPIRLENNR